MNSAYHGVPEIQGKICLNDQPNYYKLFRGKLWKFCFHRREVASASVMRFNAGTHSPTAGIKKFRYTCRSVENGNARTSPEIGKIVVENSCYLQSYILWEKQKFQKEFDKDSEKVDFPRRYLFKISKNFLKLSKILRPFSYKFAKFIPDGKYSSTIA